MKYQWKFHNGYHLNEIIYYSGTSEENDLEKEWEKPCNERKKRSVEES